MELAPDKIRTSQFVLATYAFTWIPMLTLIGLGANVSRGPAQVVFATSACGPSLMAAVMWLARPRERREHRRPVASAIALGLVLGAAVPCVPALVLHRNDLSALSLSSSAALADAGGLLGFVGLTLLAGPLAEEFGGDSVVPRPGAVGTPLELGILLLIALGVALLYMRDRKRTRPSD